MERLLSLRREVYDHFHASTIREDLFLAPGNRDRFAQYETAMLLMQDTGEALWTHRQRDFTTSLVFYIEVWGVMQAVAIQQDALLELAVALGAERPVTGAAWETIREFRNVLAGHPINKRSPITKTPLRAFMGRQPKSYRKLTYELWDKGADGTTFPQVDLGAMIDAYEAEAADLLTAILAHMRQTWPARTT